MKVPVFLVFIIAAVSLGSAITCRAEDPLEFSFYLVDHEGSQWQLMRISDKLVFVSVKPRPKPNNNRANVEGTGTGTVYIEPAGGGAPVPLRRNHLIEDLVLGGSYALSMENLKGYPKAYLTADRSTDPPTVRLEKNAGKGGRWTFIDSGKYAQAYIKHEGGPDKPAWLSLADVGTVLPAHVENAPEMVIEVRDAVLTAEKKHRISISRHSDSR